MAIVQHESTSSPLDSNPSPLAPFRVAMPPNAPRLPPSCMPPATKLSRRCNATKQQSAAWQRHLAASTSALPGVEKAPEETSTALQTPLRRELPLFLALQCQRFPQEQVQEKATEHSPPPLLEACASGWSDRLNADGTTSSHQCSSMPAPRAQERSPRPAPAPDESPNGVMVSLPTGDQAVE